MRKAILLFMFFTFLNLIKAQESTGFKKIETGNWLDLSFRVVNEVHEEISSRFVEQIPELPGGYNALAKFITDTLKYPETAIKDNITGRVITRFLIDENGKVFDVYTIEGIRNDLDSACIKAISIMPDWTKPTFNFDYGNMSIQFDLPIDFIIVRSCQFEKFLDDPNTPKLAKDIYLDKEWNLSNDKEALALLDSLSAEDMTSRPFYFKVVTKSYKKSDGYYAEGLASVGFEFVETHTQEFATYFDNKTCHTDSDLIIWADIVIGDFAISGEGEYDKPIVDEYIKRLKINCKDCSATQKETINKFALILKEKWNEFLKQLDKK